MGEQPGAASLAGAILIKQARVTGRSAAFVVVVTIPTPCYTFERTESSIAGRDVNVALFVRPGGTGPCIQVLASMEVPVAIVVPSGGSYAFHFRQSGRSTLDTTLTFP